jgi:RNA polymerase sigma factor (sigma-70 family)
LTFTTSAGGVDVESAYRAHGRRCYSLALRVVRDPNLAQDVVQDVFEALHIHSARFDQQRGQMSTWLSTLTHHKAVDLVRKREARTRHDFVADNALGSMPDASAGPEQVVVESSERARVLAALSHLSDRDRQILSLAYYDGLTQTRIAEVLGIPLGTVKSRSLAAMRRLSELLR